MQVRCYAADGQAVPVRLSDHNDWMIGEVVCGLSLGQTPVSLTCGKSFGAPTRPPQGGLVFEDLHGITQG